MAAAITKYFFNQCETSVIGASGGVGLFPPSGLGSSGVTSTISMNLRDSILFSTVVDKLAAGL